MDLVTAISTYIGNAGENQEEIFKRKNQCTVICDICKDAKEGGGIDPQDILRPIIRSMYPDDIQNVIEAATQNISAYAAGLDHLATTYVPGDGDTEYHNNLSKSNHTNLHKCTPNTAALFHEGGGKNPKELKSRHAGDKIFETPAGPLDPGTNAASDDVIPGIYDFTKTDNLGENFYFNLENYGLPANITWLGGRRVGRVFNYEIDLLGNKLVFDLNPPYNYQQLERQDIDEVLQTILENKLCANVQKNLFITRNYTPLGDDDDSHLCKLMVIFKEMGDLMQVLVFIYALYYNLLPDGYTNVIFSTSDHVVFTQIRDLLGHSAFFNKIQNNKYSVEIVHTGGRAGLQSGEMNLEIYRNIALSAPEKLKREKISLAKQMHQENFRQKTILTDARNNLQNIFWYNPNARPPRHPRPDGLSRGGFNAAQTKGLQELFGNYIQQLDEYNTELDKIIRKINLTPITGGTIDDIKSNTFPILVTKTKNIGEASYFFITPDTVFSDDFYKTVTPDMGGGARHRKQYGGKYSEKEAFEFENYYSKINLILCSCLASIAYDDEPDGGEPYGKYGPLRIEKMFLGDYLTEQGLLYKWNRTLIDKDEFFKTTLLDIEFSLQILEGNIFTESTYKYVMENIFGLNMEGGAYNMDGNLYENIYNGQFFTQDSLPHPIEISNIEEFFMNISLSIAQDYNSKYEPYFEDYEFRCEQLKISAIDIEKAAIDPIDIQKAAEYLVKQTKKNKPHPSKRLETGTGVKKTGHRLIQKPKPVIQHHMSRISRMPPRPQIAVRSGGSRKLKRKMKHYNKKSSSKTKKKLRKFKKTKKNRK